MMNFVQTEIPDVICIEPRIFEDERGFFLETYRADKFSQAGIPDTFVQDNHSRSKQGILRGLHYQIHHAQGKLVRAVLGEIFDVAVDIRRASPTYGKWVSAILSAQNKQQLWIPPGFAHGFYVMSDWAEVLYKTTDLYTPEAERCIMWNDPTLNIPWPLVSGNAPTLSPKDLNGKSFEEAEVFN